MGANNSTCLPCKAVGASARRSKETNGVHNPRDGDNQSRFLKKVSTSADPQGESRTAEQSPIPKDSPPTGIVASSSQTPQGGAEVQQLQQSFHDEAQPGPFLQPTDSSRLQQGATENEHDEQPLPEGKERQEDSTGPFSSHSRAKNVSLEQNPRKPEPATEQQPSREPPQHKPHLHVPSHMLASESDASWQKHRIAQQALLSPHSCSVAHRVAAALRAAAGERAAAAAARAADAVEAAKTIPKRSVKQLNELEFRRSFSPSSSLELRGLGVAGGTMKGDCIGQADQKQGQQCTSSQNRCFPRVSCFSVSDDSGNEISLRDGFMPSEYFVVGAAKRMGEMLSTAAAAAVQMASSAAGAKTCEAVEDNAINPNYQWVSGLADGQERQMIGQMDNEKSGEPSESAAVLLGAMDRAMDTINSDDFKRQAVTLLSQSISVAASVVEAVKKCGDAPHSDGAFRSAYPVRGLEVTGCATELTGYYEALRISAQQQLSERAGHPQLSV